MLARLSLAGKLMVVGLVVAAVGIVIQIIAGVDYPPIPPGLFILLIPAGLIAFSRWWWTPIVGTLAGLFILVGFVLSSSMGRLLEVNPFGVFIGTWFQFLAVIVTVIAGIVATMQNYQNRTPSERSNLVAFPGARLAHATDTLTRATPTAEKK